ncbi:hypothetical protein DF021_31545 [Burkholderia stagnalis]|uniref:Uncharacterized protein n=1 Tax=Burkholderia stagnalis TaxID=1503054 RepID=A0ABX9YEN6_9BURK|nr:hypothetical protein DF158_31310 [Burkholderia stagnalis]RQQ59779.1 hypothetical protein DF137_33180 [Burkholderia stagnalis]RQQ61137.1 hypothetical protein DF139_31680 [Burkholderia stagnalis]RQQ74730.1 hypothetical protein DF138_32565 [Burkholderia stagnalis]RQQ80373.1 hypothetical protein DF136_33080 [Burkholderia stagnalis]
MSGKCKAASCESLMPLKRYRVNQHNSVDYFLQRSKGCSCPPTRQPPDLPALFFCAAMRGLMRVRTDCERF